MRVDVPAIPEAGGPPDGRISIGTDPDRWMWLLPRMNVRPRIGQRPEPTLEGDRLLGPEPLHEREAFVQHREPVGEVDPDDLTAHTVAAKVGLPVEQVFKTLVARGDRHGVCFALVPGHCRLDLKALAKVTGPLAAPWNSELFWTVCLLPPTGVHDTVTPALPPPS